MIEKWKDIKDFENYEVSNLGNVRNKRTGHIYEHNINRYGYVEISLYKNKKGYSRKVHRLVAEAFIPNPENLLQVNHKDEDKTNNKVDNLEWCDNKYNSNYGTRSKRIAEKLSIVLRKPIRQYKNGELIKVWGSIKEASETLNITRTNIIKCLKGKRYTAGGYSWEYED